MAISAKEAMEMQQMMGQAAQFGELVTMVLSNKELTEPYIEAIKKAGGVVAPLVEDVTHWSLGLYMAQMRRLMDDFSVSPMEAAQILALRKPNTPPFNFAKAVESGIQEAKKKRNQ
jgi:hypothetical protein